MAVQTLDISPVGRVEGDLDVRVDIDNGVVTNAWTSAELFRGFEIILRDKDPQAGLVVTPRACGICGASHLTCAAWALDTAWQTEVPRNAILARNLGQITESLQSQPRYFYGLYAIDMTNKKYKNSKYYAEAVKRFAPFTGTSYEAGVTISGKPVEIYALLGGQWPHSSYMVPGGVMCAPTLSDITRAWSILDYFKNNWLENIWLGCTLERYEQIKTYDDFMVWLDESPAHANSDLGFYWKMGLDIGLDLYGGGVGRYVTWGYLPHEDKYNKPTVDSRNASVIMKSGVYDGKTDTKATQVVRYFDAMNFATRIKCPTIVSVGFIDKTCPATSVFSAYNNIPAGVDKKIVMRVDMGHAFPADLISEWDQVVKDHVASMRQTTTSAPTK